MKILFTFCLVAALIQCVNATVITVCNMPYSPGQYTDFQDAVNNANTNDTIYVHGSNFNYGSTFIYLPIVVIGTGYNPNKQTPLVSSFETIDISSNNVQLIGLKFNNLISNSDNITIKRCRILGFPFGPSLEMTNATSCLIEGNIFDNNANYSIDFRGYDTDETIVQHNIFHTEYTAIRDIGNNSSSKTYILNNIFLGNGFNSTFDYVFYTEINNNIFYGCSPYAGNSSLETNSMNNCISYNCSDNSFIPGGINNIQATDPEFVNVPSAVFDYTYDYHLAPSSPAKNYGTDGTDLGVYGGIGTYFTMTGEPPIAEVTVFTITSPTTISPGGTLDISVTSTRIH